MCRNVFHLLSWLAIAGAILAGTSALAQNRQREREIVRCAGKVKAVGPGVLQVVGEEGQQWLVSVEARPQNISFQGSASPGFLRPGMLVQFRAVLDKKAESHAPITEIKVIALREGVQLGIQPEGGAGGGELFTSDDDNAGKKKKKSPDGKPYLVAGTLRGIKDRKFYVAAGGATIKGEIAENCSVSLDVSDYSLARDGDPIMLQGWHFPGQPNQIYATELTITAEKPLIAPEDAKKRRAPAKGGEKDSPESKAGENQENPAGKKAATKKES